MVDNLFIFSKSLIVLFFIILTETKEKKGECIKND